MSNSIVSFDLDSFPMDMLLRIIFFLGVEGFCSLATTSKLMFKICIETLFDNPRCQSPQDKYWISVSKFRKVMNKFGCQWDTEPYCGSATWNLLCDFHSHKIKFQEVLFQMGSMTGLIRTHTIFRSEQNAHINRMLTGTWEINISPALSSIDERLAQAEKDGHVYTLKYYMPHRPCPQTLKNGCCSICKR